MILYTSLAAAASAMGRSCRGDSSTTSAPTIRVRDANKRWHVARRDYAAEQGHISGGKANWPLHCHAGGVHANEVPRHRKNVEKAGLNVTVENDGSVTIPSQKEYRRYCKAFGLTHYSDFMA